MQDNNFPVMFWLLLIVVLTIISASVTPLAFMVLSIIEGLNV